MRRKKVLEHLLIGLGVASLVGVLIVGWMNYRSLDDFVSRDEVARVTSPSGAVDAVLVETNGGATTSFGYEVFVVEAGSSFDAEDSIAALYAAVRNGSAYGANLRWRAPDVLSIEYLTARSAELYQRSIEVSGVRIAAGLKSGVEDLTAPAGGMLMNLQAASSADQQ